MDQHAKEPLFSRQSLAAGGRQLDNGRGVEHLGGAYIRLAIVVAHVNILYMSYWFPDTSCHTLLNVFIPNEFRLQTRGLLLLTRYIQNQKPLLGDIRESTLMNGNKGLDLHYKLLLPSKKIKMSEVLFRLTKMYKLADYNGQQQKIRKARIKVTGW